MVFLFNCHWTGLASGSIANVYHNFWTDKQCLALPHIAHMAFALVVVIVFCCAVMAMVRAGREGDCKRLRLHASSPQGTRQTPRCTHPRPAQSQGDCDLNPLTRNMLGTPSVRRCLPAPVCMTCCPTSAPRL